ncbi:MAG: acylphosphatase [Alphaproteobacteria bacterium]
MSEETAVRVRITGRVQGVGYRYWVVDQEALLHLDGWVRNRRDGGVEAVFVGPGEALTDMIAQCHQGPVLARIDGVAETPYSEAVAAGFRALPTI